MPHTVSTGAWYVQAVLALLFMYPYLFLLRIAADIGLENLNQEKKENEK